MNDDGRLGDIGLLARMLVDYDREVERAEEALSAAKENARRIREESLPTAMQEIGMEKVVLDTGETVTIDKDVFVQLSEEMKPRAYGWLEENGHGALIKTEVAIAFGKDERQDAVKFAEEMAVRGLNPETVVNVHAQTLKAFLRRQLEDAKPCPLDLFGARPVSKAKVKLPKEKK